MTKNVQIAVSSLPQSIVRTGAPKVIGSFSSEYEYDYEYEI
jgi:hypothetical protein